MQALIPTVSNRLVSSVVDFTKVRPMGFSLEYIKILNASVNLDSNLTFVHGLGFLSRGSDSENSEEIRDVWRKRYIRDRFRMDGASVNCKLVSSPVFKVSRNINSCSVFIDRDYDRICLPIP